MKSIFNDIANSNIVLSIIAILLGIVMIVYPGMSLVALGAVTAAFLIVEGIALIVLDIKASRMFIPFDGMLQGILSLILGILLAVNPTGMAVYVGISVGLWIIISGFAGIRLAVELRHTAAPWVLLIIMNIISIIIGVVVMVTPIISSQYITILMGVVLIAHAVVEIIDMIVVKKNIREVDKLIIEKQNSK